MSQPGGWRTRVWDRRGPIGAILAEVRKAHAGPSHRWRRRSELPGSPTGRNRWPCRRLRGRPDAPRWPRAIHGRIPIRLLRSFSALLRQALDEVIMHKTVEAVIEPDGRVRLVEPVRVGRPRRALVTILDDESESETALLSEAALAEDWDRPEEDEAWQHLQPAR